MTYKKMFLFIIIICFIVVGLQTSHTPKQVNAFTSQVIQKGAVGDDVIELQARLQYLGFYNGNIDGVFGWGTYWALRNFQYEFGLKVDGLAGLTTRQKLVEASEYDRKYVKEQIKKGKDFTHYGGVDNTKQTTPDKEEKQQNTNNKNNQQGANNNQQTKAEPTAVNVPQGYSQNDIQLMANAVHGESRGESYVGQVAVAAVILNRVESSTFPNTVSGVVFEPRAFTAVADGQIWLTPNEQAKEAVLDAVNGWDPSGNAIYYFNPETATSDWIWSRKQIKKIGKHIFAK
ncbi:N-acetylmuramoyl-L-alanine amidase [Virgibacillus subterraneus]|uniref:Spore cortex-lytic enzyme n=2 Tax=Virgibacillus TaxID=84406 RepID=A0A1H1BPX7_9BACI|nr:MULTISPECIES: spore cortex-lytic enzyme [Virgibacillus]SDQ54024.1 N-acetylmuramoyl-L-alanine amidase [Virgibacillus salinus]SEQ25202.1 N-acetylmuramoyl-L-alanine amidase [Virgibacillus subterraneus]